MSSHPDAFGRRVLVCLSGLTPQEFGLYAYLAQRRLRSDQLDDELAGEGLVVALVDEAKFGQR